MILAVNKRAFEEYDDDRKRLARHLHSTAAQELAALQLSLSLIPVDELSPRAAQAAADCARLAQSSAREIRAVTQRLHPALLEEAGLTAAISAFAAGIGMKETPTFTDVCALPPALALHAYRIVEELVLASDPPEGSKVRLHCDTRFLSIHVGGAGEIRKSVHERVGSLGGRLSFFVTPYKTVSVQLPITTEES